MTELKQILCAVDFSEFSRRALDHALGVARCYGSTITALHVVAPMPLVAPGLAGLGAETPPFILPPPDGAIVAAQMERLTAAEGEGKPL
jgi:nucleotide-binding universal stress UspA family protein